MSRFSTGLTAVFVIQSLLGGPASYAQTADICVAETLSAPARVVYHCPNGLVIEAEAAAVLDLVMSPDRARIDAVTLKDQAVLIELEPGYGTFQIKTPYAIASVRGTVFLVDAQENATSVFVVTGVVAVSRGEETNEVTLLAGEGVSVSPDEELTVRTWPAEKVSMLLARFAR